MRVMSRFGAMVALVLFWVPASASATPVVAGSFLDGVHGCTTANCAAGTDVFVIPLPGGGVSGSITLNTGTNMLDFNLSVVFANFDENVAGTEFNGVADVEFSTMNYVGTGIALIPTLPNQYSFFGVATVTGTQTQRDDVGTIVNGGAINQTPNITGSCDASAAPSITCGIFFGPTNFAFDVGDGVGPDQTINWQHSIDLLAVPEPSTFAMVGLALAGLGMRSRRRS